MTADRKPMTALEIAERAYALIEDPARWTTNFFARNKQGGASVEPESQQATCWCSLGAVRRVIGPELINAEAEIARALEAATGEWITEFNDTHSHAEVLAGWRKAIESLRAKESA